MSTRESTRVGSTAALRVQFFDSSGDPVEATGVSVDIFSPTQNPDTDSPILENLIPTYLGNGVFQVTFTAQAPEGSWTDKWTGNILGTETTAELTFSVIGSGVITTYPTFGLLPNTLIEVLLSEDISDLDGNSLTEDLSIVFTTELSPFYSSVRKVKLDSGGLLGNIDNYAISLAILEASIEADVLSFRKSIINNNLFIHARRQFVTCLAGMNLAQNILANGGVLRSKMLADFKVEYDNRSVGDLLNRLQDCVSKWELQLQSGGGARTIRNPKMVVKGELDPDRPATGRLWYRIDPGELPVGNSKYRVTGSRRFKTGFLSRKIPVDRSSW